MKSQALSTPTTPTDGGLQHLQFTTKLRAIGALTLSAIPALFGPAGIEPSQQNTTFAALATNSVDGEHPALANDAVKAGQKSEAVIERGAKLQEIKITEEIAVSDGSRVKPNTSGYYGHGYILGSPINSGDTGFFFPTYELHINQGYFPDDLSYIGSSVPLSIDGRNQTAFENFRNVEKESHQQFVFEYIVKHPMNPEIEDSHLFLQKIYSLDEFLALQNTEALPNGIRAETPWDGSNGTKTKVGRIVDIQRYGQLGDFCVLELNMSGLSGISGGEKIVQLTVIDEDIARWCEKAMSFGRDVEVEVAQDAIENWEPSSNFVTAIKFKETPSLPAAVSKEQYEMIREQLSKDPVFIESLRQQLSQPPKDR